MKLKLKIKPRILIYLVVIALICFFGLRLIYKKIIASQTNLTKETISKESVISECMRFSSNLLQGKSNQELGVKLGVSLIKAKEYLKAKKVFEEVLFVEPTNISVLNNLAYIAGEMNENTRAIEYLRTAIQISDKCAECTNNLGSLLFKQGKNEEAKKLFEKASEMSPQYLDPFLNLAILLEEQSEWANAAIWYKEAETKTSDVELKKTLTQRVLWMTEIAINTKRTLAQEK